MKELFFNAVAGHRKVAPALMSQTSNTLRPFDEYLRQAISVARERQSRYKLRWERVKDQRTLNLQALDTWITVPKPPLVWLLTDWPANKSPPIEQPLVVVNRPGETFDVLSCERIDRGLRLQVAGELQESDIVFWDSEPCQLQAEAANVSPSALTDANGKPFEIRAFEDVSDDSWRLLVEGDANKLSGELLLDGQPVEYEVDRALPEKVYDSGNVLMLSGGQLKVEELPSDDLKGDNGIRYRWYESGGKRGGKRGFWIQLLQPEESSADEFLDPRAAFCEDNVEEVWTDERKHKGNTIEVKRVDRDKYQLLVDPLPDPKAMLHLPLDTRSLNLQRRALSQLRTAPLPHHQGLLRLCENPKKVKWPELRPKEPKEWFVLTDEARSGTSEQRKFVAQALCGLEANRQKRADITLLEGPPGSGKTTAICELIRQLVEQNRRVLLCGSTHYSIDNVIERLMDCSIDILRIGRAERVDSKVQSTQLDARVEELAQQWKDIPELAGHGEDGLEGMAEKTIVMGADLTCGTTMGIVNHPLFRGKDGDLKGWQRPIASQPWWDVLIVDEASKTTIQEFLVPALMARQWVIVGDVKQLPPFAEHADIKANLREMVDGTNKDKRNHEIFPADHQRACLLLWRLRQQANWSGGARFLVAEPPRVLDFLEAEIEAHEESGIDAVRVVMGDSGRSRSGLPRVSAKAIRDGAPSALRLAGATWVLVPDNLLSEISDHLPANMLRLGSLDKLGISENDSWIFRQKFWLSHAPKRRQPAHSGHRRQREPPTLSQLEDTEIDWFSQKDWASEVTWRLTRIHELKHSSGQGKEERARYRKAIERLSPCAVDITGKIDTISDIGLPSILEVLQEGIGENRSKRSSALTEGFSQSALGDRFTSLVAQHRMHPEISEFPRRMFYGGKALEDANTIDDRDKELGWDFAPEFEKRRVWLDVSGKEQGGVNESEVNVMEAVVHRFLEWAEKKAKPQGKWELACLTFYTKQEAAIRQMLRRVTGDQQGQTRFYAPNVEIVAGTVDRFQGREADLVLLSMRNTRRIGFLDSVNRLNVAVTRARQQLVIVGKRGYFKNCRISELEALAQKTQGQDSRRWNYRGRQ